MRELLGPEGPFARLLDGYQARAGQLEMADAVQRALREERLLLCEAGTGTGKTLAYLVPALLSGKKVVVSTATRALQDQIVSRDLPLIARALGIEPEVQLMKGLGNYLCRRRYQQFRSGPEALRPAHARSLTSVEGWVQESETGDLSELAGIEESDPVLAEIASSSETRVGQSCAYHEECFVTRMRRGAERARLLIVNHHLFFADLALRGPHPGRVLPNYDAVIFDEAHQLEDVATLFFGARVSAARVARVLRDAERSYSSCSLLDSLLSGPAGRQTLDALASACDGFWKRLLREGQGDGRTRIERDLWAGELADRWHRLDDCLERLASFSLASAERLKQPGALAGPRGREKEALLDALVVLARRAEQLRTDLAAMVDGAPGRIVWLDNGRMPALSASPIDVSDIFRERIFESIPAVVLTSATLASGGASSDGEQHENDDAPPEPPEPLGPFSYLRARLGMNQTLDVTELKIDSPFDFGENALLYTPRDLPSPRHPSFLGAAAGRIAELIEAAGGGAFVLTTSMHSMRALHAALAKRDVKQLLLQGTRPKNVLLSSFRAANNAVLCATMSFWEGVDVPGHALRLVVIDKIPFAVPTDPVVQARAQALEDEGGNPFMDFYVPAAAITLKQGFGRLIRNQHDRGVVALLDPRIHRGYGKRLLNALPPARRTDEAHIACEFARGLRPSG